MSKATLNQTLVSKLGKRAWLYLRVSTPGQVHTDYNPEGISIPAQREAGTRKAAELGAAVADEFIEPGRTATSIEKRPVFQEMLAAVRAASPEELPDYIIVYHFNRIFRNSIDAAITKKELAKYGVRVVSTVLDMGESPESAMVESIIHAVDQYQSQASGADIRYKMGQKVKNGGTVGQAKLGYRNVREPKPEGGEVRTIAVDEERAPIVVQAFELFATGQYTGQQVLDQITAAGLTSRGTRGTLPKPISLNTLYRIFSDRYYLGRVTYQDEEYPGRHQALVTSELFNRVQRVLAIRGGGDTRQRRYNHWLKGNLWCGRCGKRLIIQRGKGNGGIYFYFACIGRQQRTCDQPYIKLHQLEDAVETHYATVRLSPEFIANVKRQLDDTMTSELNSMATLKRQLSTRLAALDAKEEKYLDLVGEPGWPKDKLRKKLNAIAAERAEINGQLTNTTDKLNSGRQFIRLALELLSDPQTFYRRCGSSVKRALTKLIFARLYVDDGEITSHDLADGLGDLIEAQAATVRTYERSQARLSLAGADTPALIWSSLSEALSPQNGATNDSSPLLVEGAAWDRHTSADLLAVALGGHGSSRAAVVELMRLTPGDVRPANIAFLEDRLLTIDDKPQIYGTQFRNIGDGWEPFPIEDSEHVDERRASVGLGTLAENEARIKATYTP